MGMTYSKIERSFWETDEARELTPEEKYFWMYLQTNANVNTLGCYARSEEHTSELQSP